MSAKIGRERATQQLVNMTFNSTFSLATKAVAILHLFVFLSTGANATNASDCSSGHVDSTCESRVNFTSQPTNRVVTLFQGRLETGPYAGNEYWGWDFETASSITRDNLVPQVFVNRSSQAVTIAFLTSVPDSGCPDGCLPGYEFQLGPKRRSQYPTPSVNTGAASVKLVVPPGQSYAWVIGMKNSPPPMTVIVTVPLDIGTTLSDVGLPANLDIATPIAPQALTCPCPDGSIAPCSIGTHFSSGLISLYSKATGATPPDAYNDCPAER